MCIVAQNEWGHIYTSETRRKAIRPFVSFIILTQTSNTWNRYGPGPILAHKRERRAEGSGTGEAALLELWKWGKRRLGKQSRRCRRRWRTQRHRHYWPLLPKQGLYSHSPWLIYFYSFCLVHSCIPVSLVLWFIRASLSPSPSVCWTNQANKLRRVFVAVKLSWIELFRLGLHWIMVWIHDPGTPSQIEQWGRTGSMSLFFLGRHSSVVGTYHGSMSYIKKQ